MSSTSTPTHNTEMGEHGVRENVDGGVGAETMTLLVKNPSGRLSPYTLHDVPVRTTIRDIKLQLENEYPDHPRASVQKLVYLGRILEDSARVDDVFNLSGDSPSSPATIKPVVDANNSGGDNQSLSSTKRIQTVHIVYPQDKTNPDAHMGMGKGKEKEKGKSEAPTTHTNTPSPPAFMPPPQSPPSAAAAAAVSNAMAQYSAHYQQWQMAAHAHYMAQWQAVMGQAQSRVVDSNSNITNVNVATAPQVRVPVQVQVIQQQQPAPAQPAAPGPGPVARGARAFVVNITLSSIIKYGLIIYLLSHLGFDRAIIFSMFLVGLFFGQRMILPIATRIVRFAVQGRNRVRNGGGGGDERERAEGGGEGEGEGALDENERQVQRQGIVQKVLRFIGAVVAFFVGFFSSLFPSWRPEQANDEAHQHRD